MTAGYVTVNDSETNLQASAQRFSSPPARSQNISAYTTAYAHGVNGFLTRSREKIILEHAREQFEKAKKSHTTNQNTIEIKKTTADGKRPQMAEPTPQIAVEMEEPGPDDLDTAEIISEKSGEDTVIIDRNFPFKQITDEKNPAASSVRLGVKTRSDYDDVNKYKLADPKKSKHFNQYQNLGQPRARTKNKFFNEPGV